MIERKFRLLLEPIVINSKQTEMKPLQKSSFFLLKMLWKESLNGDGQNSRRTITSYLNPLNIKKTMTYEFGNPDPGLGQAHTCGGIKPVNGTPTHCIFQICWSCIYHLKVWNNRIMTDLLQCVLSTHFKRKKWIQKIKPLWNNSYWFIYFVKKQQQKNTHTKNNSIIDNYNVLGLLVYHYTCIQFCR